MPEHSQTLDKNALRGVRVLIVDDEPVLASTFCLVLQFAGAYAQSAEHGLAALALLAEETFDLILTDKHMPVMDGPHFIRALNERGDTTPILLFINAADYSAMEEIRDLRIDGTVTKPLSPSELVGTIRRTIQKHG